VFNIQD